MKYTNASHGGIVLGILPLTTAAVSTLLLKQRLSIWFWVCAILGSVIVIGFSLKQASGSLQIADICLFIAVIAASFGYVKGAKLTQKMAGIEVISWALVLILPIIIPIALFNMPSHDVLNSASLNAWLCFLYMALISQYLGFLPWYKGLALGGVAQVGQLQLLQPFFTLIISALLLGEHLSSEVVICCLSIMAVVYTGRKLSYKKS
jgi:drug/metabolite transporter (DMT)-like permease